MIKQKSKRFTSECKFSHETSLRRNVINIIVILISYFSLFRVSVTHKDDEKHLGLICLFCLFAQFVCFLSKKKTLLKVGRIVSYELRDRKIAITLFIYGLM